ncbi:retrotransposon protein, putative, ty1-copia subclass [Tanacetum coccineum]
MIAIPKRIVRSIDDKFELPRATLPLLLLYILAGQHVAPEILAAHTTWVKGSKEIAGLMLMTMEPEIQRNLENLHANDMLKELKTLFAQQAEQELLQTMRDFHSCKQEEGQSVSSYVLKMKGYIDNLERLGHPVTLGLAVSLILIGLRKEFDGFVQNYNMHSLGKTVNELHAMLKLHEQTLPKNNVPALHAIRAGKVQKGKKHNKPQPSKAARGQNQGNGKNKHAYAPKPKIPPPPKREDPAKDSICHECGETGHWKRNYPQYLAELLKKKKNAASGAGGGSGIFVIELNTFLNKSWIYDTGCAVEAIGNFDLSLPNGLVIILNNCHYAPSITRGVISVSRLYEEVLFNSFRKITIQVSRNNMVYFSAIPRDGIFEIDLSNSYANESSIYTLSNKRAKLDLDSALLWHCRLGHISKKRIEKLQHDGLLNSTDLRAFEKCVPCMSGKMARKPYTHQVERAKDLLVTKYTREHKHEVFETFKVFQKEVENQLGSWDFAHPNSSFTLHNTMVVGEEKQNPLRYGSNHDYQTTLPKSFWDYALKTAARILNMVPTKKNSLINQEASGSLEDLEIIQEEDTHPSIDTSLNHEEDYLEMDKPQLRRDLGEPTNYKSALLDPESDKWLNAMNVEMQSMKDNEVWVLIELPPNGKTVGSKWLFKKKTNMDGAVHTYKARLVAKGYTQTPGIDYEETFSPVADIRAIRILIAIAAYYDYEIWQMDVKTAFLNGYLNEEVYMEQPEGFVNPKYPNRVCKLKHSIYGLKQASRQWNKRFDDEIKKFGFSKNADEPCVYLKASGIMSLPNLSAKQSIFATSSAEAEYIAAFVLLRSQWV